MKTPQAFLTVCFSLVSLTACGPKLSSQGLSVKVAESAPAETCRVIGTVEAENSNEPRAQVMLRNKAGEMRANTVVVTRHTEEAGRIKLVGQAFGCEHKNCACHHPASETCPHCLSGHQDTSAPTPCPHCAAKTGQTPATTMDSDKTGAMPAPVAPQAVPVAPEVPPANMPVTP